MFIVSVAIINDENFSYLIHIEFEQDKFYSDILFISLQHLSLTTMQP